MALAATTTAFVRPGATITRKQWSKPASRLFMAADDEIEKKDSQYFFANQASKTTVQTETNGESKATPESATMPPEIERELKLSELVQPKTKSVESKVSSESATAFDPFQVSSEGNQLEQVNLNGVVELKQEQDKQEIGIWAARGILLLVALFQLILRTHKSFP
jgi:recombination DNA repair RAD52 pathway protein